MTDGFADIRGSVLENLSDGVIVVERGGTVSVFNEAAGRILGLAPDEAVGGSFAQLFIDRDGFEELSGLILDAVTGESDAGRQVVALERGGEARSLSVATSYLRSGADG